MPKKKSRTAAVNKDGLLKSVLQDTFVDAMRLIIPNADEIYDFSKNIVFSWIRSLICFWLVERKVEVG